MRCVVAWSLALPYWLAGCALMGLQSIVARICDTRARSINRHFLERQFVFVFSKDEDR